MVAAHQSQQRQRNRELLRYARAAPFRGSLLPRHRSVSQVAPPHRRQGGTAACRETEDRCFRHSRMSDSGYRARSLEPGPSQHVAQSNRRVRLLLPRHRPFHPGREILKDRQSSDLHERTEDFGTPSEKATGLVSCYAGVEHRLCLQVRESLRAQGLGESPRMRL